MCQSSSCKSEVTSLQNKEQSIQRQGNCARCLMYRHTSPINRQAAGTLLPPRLPERLSAATSHRISHIMHRCPDERIAQRHSTHHPPISLSLSPSTPAPRNQMARNQHTALAGGHSKPSHPFTDCPQAKSGASADAKQHMYCRPIMHASANGSITSAGTLTHPRTPGHPPHTCKHTHPASVPTG